MTQEEIKQFIADKTAAGMSLTAIQDALSAQGVKIRFMELRLLAAEIESVLEKKEAEKAAAATPAPEEKKAEEAPASAPAEPASPAPDGAAKVRGATTVSVSPIQRPGFAMSGSVSFGSGVTADWYVDQTGRLGLDNASGQPDEQDIQEFQIELRKALGM
ncbi:MAG: hypothetical protein J6R64_02100 [Lentisphaeria bacterium]|nr:hypothetical protein [Lentisphaeria bacterium]MBO5802514.1 hypothetical protein [Lentisphaeria bacterium]MBO5960198.1 hypothetical protein [Lentisphaeria bacterium]MBR4884059.1 hypothetical protein [Lentisphaeria bacterium]